MNNISTVTLSANRQMIQFLGREIPVSFPSEASVADLSGVLRIDGAGSGGELNVQLPSPPLGILTLEAHSWLEGWWADFAKTEPQRMPSPVVLVWPEGLLIVAGEFHWRGSDAVVTDGGCRITMDLREGASVWLAAGEYHMAMGALADAMMEGVERLTPHTEPLKGWMSWDELRFDLSEGDVVENAKVIADRFGPGDSIVLLDDGWQMAAGDWQPNERFSHGMNWLTDRIHRLGLRAGLWVAPFLVALRSPLGKANPDWFLLGEDGEPLVELDLKHWGGKVGTLDPTRPEVLDWLHELGRTVRDWEFDYLKMDFLHHALTGQCANDVPRGTAYREGIRAIRDGLGPKVLTMGCGTSMITGRGLFHSARVGQDSVTDWGLLRGPFHCIALRQPFHRRWWCNDPDNVIVREPMTIDQARMWASCVAMTGGNLFLGDDLRKLPAERWEIDLRLWPPAPIDPRVIGVAKPRPGETRPAGDGWFAPVKKPWETNWVVTFTNCEDVEVERSVPWNELGIPAGDKCHIWDFWNETYRGEATDSVTATLAPMSCTVLALSPVKAHPTVIGLTRHVVVGSFGLADLEWSNQSSTLSGETSDSLKGLANTLAVFQPSGWKIRETAGCKVESTTPCDGEEVLKVIVEGDAKWKIAFDSSTAG